MSDLSLKEQRVLEKELFHYWRRLVRPIAIRANLIKKDKMYTFPDPLHPDHFKHLTDNMMGTLIKAFVDNGVTRKHIIGAFHDEHIDQIIKNMGWEDYDLA